MIPSRVPTNSVKTASMWSRPARTSMMSELGLVYFLGSMAEKKVVRVYMRVLESWQDDVYMYVNRESNRTSRACKSATPPPFFKTSMARANSCLVWGCKVIMSSGDRSTNIFWREALSGLRRKNSRQKPSDCSVSGSISSYGGRRVACHVSAGQCEIYAKLASNGARSTEKSLPR